jgi:hypothetical protein
MNDGNNPITLTLGNCLTGFIYSILIDDVFNTRYSLDFLYPRTNVGGLRVCDDSSGSNPPELPPASISCGNGILEPLENEDCDTGGAVGCDGLCKVVTDGYTCVSADGDISNCTAICGNSKVHPPETCDDGGAVCNVNCNGFLVTHTCTGGSTTAPTICNNICGDSLFVPADEQCDNGGVLPGCVNCNVDTPGYSCTSATNDVSNCTAICGNSKVHPPETCDDVGTICNSTCNGFPNTHNCVGGSTTNPTLCTAICGDGKAYLPDEECDT